MPWKVRPVQYPAYWQRSEAELKQEFAELHECSGPERTWLQGLIDSTYLKRKTRDRRTGHMGVGLQIVAALRVENSNLWKAYIARRDRIAQARLGIGHDQILNSSVRPPMSSAVVANEVPRELDASVREAYLFHGTTAVAAVSIQREGFCLELAGSKTGRMFGKGIYLAEASSKADEYATGCEDFHTILICRAACGNSFRVTEGDFQLEEKMRGWRMQRFNSVVGDREAAVGTYREYVFYDAAQIYPEYVVIYRRMHLASAQFAPPILVHTSGDDINNDMLLFCSGGNWKAQQVPTSLACFFGSMPAMPFRLLSLPDRRGSVLFVDTTGNGRYNVNLFAPTACSTTWTPLPRGLDLPLAALLGDLDAVQAMAANTKDFEEPRLRGMTALDIACAKGHADIVTFLEFATNRIPHQAHHEQMAKFEAAMLETAQLEAAFRRVRNAMEEPVGSSTPSGADDFLQQLMGSLDDEDDVAARGQAHASSSGSSGDSLDHALDLVQTDSEDEGCWHGRPPLMVTAEDTAHFCGGSPSSSASPSRWSVDGAHLANSGGPAELNAGLKLSFRAPCGTSEQPASSVAVQDVSQPTVAPPDHKLLLDQDISDNIGMLDDFLDRALESEAESSTVEIRSECHCLGGVVPSKVEAPCVLFEAALPAVNCGGTVHNAQNPCKPIECSLARSLREVCRSDATRLAAAQPVVTEFHVNTGTPSKGDNEGLLQSLLEELLRDVPCEPLARQ